MQQQKVRLRVLSYNIHKGLSLTRRRLVLSGIKEAITLIEPDLVFLQEIIGRHRKHEQRFDDWPESSQCEYLAGEIWPHFVYAENAVYNSGHHGNAVLSKFPILEHQNIDLSTNRVERRGLLHAAVKLPSNGCVLHCFSTHLGLFQRDRKRQLERICSHITQAVDAEHPVIIAGDFNDWTKKASEVLSDKLGAHEIFEANHGKHVPTFPVQFRLLSLDRIYCRGLFATELEVLEGDPWRTLSDHAPLLAELQEHR